MRKHLAAVAALAMVSGTAGAQDLPTDALTQPLLGGADVLITGIEGGTSALIGGNAEGGAAPGPIGGGSGLLGGADLLGDVLNGAAGEVNDGATEGGDFTGNTLQATLETLSGGAVGGTDALTGGIQAGSDALVMLIEDGVMQLENAGGSGLNGSALSSLPTLDGLSAQ